MLTHYGIFLLCFGGKDGFKTDSSLSEGALYALLFYEIKIWITKGSYFSFDGNRRILCVCKMMENGKERLFKPNYSALGPAATNALPASLPVYLVKFLTKRFARSFALASHSATSA